MAFEITRNLGQITQSLEKKTKQAAMRRGNIIAKEAVLRASDIAHEELGSKNGNYANGFFALPTVESGARQVTMTIGNRSKFARLIEHGRKSYVIRPKNKQSLAWPGERSTIGLGKTVLRPGQTVTAPALEGHHIIKRAMNYALQRQRGSFRGRG